MKQPRKNIYKIKYYKEYILTALLNDLELDKATGIKKETFAAIEQIFNQMVDLAYEVDLSDAYKIKLEKHFHKNVNELKHFFIDWHKAELGITKERAFTLLRNHKIRVFATFKRELQKMEESDPNFKTFLSELQRIENSQLELLHESLEILAADSKFRILKSALTRFRKQ